jgi:lactoylglutathione lyase
MVAIHHFLFTTLFLSFQLLYPTSAQDFPPGFHPGADGPASEATEGFWINHTGLNVRNLTASKAFYGSVLGMRHIFTIDYTDHFSLTYMGFSQGGRNGTGFQTGEELRRIKNNAGGMIKLLHFSASESAAAVPTERTTTLSNLGLVVPDLQEAENWFERHGVKIVKKRGVNTLAGDSDVAVSFNIGPESTSNQTEVEELVKGLQTTDFGNVVFIEDPDGNLLEVIEQNGF